MTDAGSSMSSDTRKRIMLYGVLLVAVIALGAFMLLRGNGSGSADSASVGLPASPVHPATVIPSAAAVSPTPSPTPVVAAHDPFGVPAAMQKVLGASTGGAAAPAAASLTPGALTPSDLAALQAAGYTVTQNGASPSPGASGSPSSAKASPKPSSTWLQLLAAHQQADGTFTVDVRTATGTSRGIKVGAVNVGGTHLGYLGEDTELGKATYVFTISSTVGANLVPNASVPAFSGTLTPANRESTLVYTNGTLSGGIF
jgi:hypothetical protein